MSATRQSRRDKKLFQKHADVIIRELRRTASPSMDGGPKIEFAVANLGKWPETAYLVSDTERQEELRQQIIEAFGIEPCIIEFRAAFGGPGVVVTAHFG